MDELSYKALMSSQRDSSKVSGFEDGMESSKASIISNKSDINSINEFIGVTANTKDIPEVEI